MLKESRSLLELADNLERFLGEMKEQNHPMGKYEALYRQLLLYEGPFNRFNYKVSRYAGIVAPYLLTNWTLYDQGEHNCQQLQRIVDQIRQNFIPSKSHCISEDSIHRLMNHMEERFGYCSKVLRDKPLRIVIADEAYRDGNSLFMACYDAGIKPSAHSKRDIVIATKVEGKVAPEFSFLHELGHILHLRLTQRYDIFTPPSSFDFIINQMFSKSIDKPDSIKAELFAECFAMAALYASEHSNYDYVEYIRNEEKILCYLYFKVLLETYESNDMGRTSWNELLTKIDTEAFIQHLPDNTSSH